MFSGTHSVKKETRRFTTKDVENLLLEAVTAIKTWSCKEYNGLRVDKIEGLYEKYIQELIIQFPNVQEISIVRVSDSADVPEWTDLLWGYSV